MKQENRMTTRSLENNLSPKDIWHNYREKKYSEVDEILLRIRNYRLDSDTN